ncbi:hypothetical protein MJM43_29605, partial [Salmonella enterica subsp. enterica serovar Montevideo]|nr:hypothetical protein [Salmonella enterica subsp. enterica serovar Montevideo]
GVGEGPIEAIIDARNQGGYFRELFDLCARTDTKKLNRRVLEKLDILERVGVTCVMVTHDQEEAMTMAGRIAIMNRGKFVQIGEP